MKIVQTPCVNHEFNDSTKILLTKLWDSCAQNFHTVYYVWPEDVIMFIDYEANMTSFPISDVIDIPHEKQSIPVRSVSNSFKTIEKIQDVPESLSQYLSKKDLCLSDYVIYSIASDDLCLTFLKRRGSLLGIKNMQFITIAETRYLLLNECENAMFVVYFGLFFKK